MRRRGAGVAVCCALVGVLAGAGQAHAFLYAVSGDRVAITRSPLDGPGFSSFIYDDATFISGVAVDQGHVYWGNYSDGAIGRSNIDGTGVDEAFIPNAAPADGISRALRGVAVDATHVYWSHAGIDAQTSESIEEIGRANLDGSGADPHFVSNLTNVPEALTVDAGHIYWTAQGVIGRAAIDGTAVQPDWLATTSPGSLGVAVDADHIYWSNTDSTPNNPTIGRANLDGTGVDQNFITGTERPTGLAVDGAHIYWENSEAGRGGSLGRANLDGTGVNQNFITGVSADAIAVDALLPRATSTSVVCTPATVPSGAASTCTATVTDTADGAPSSPTGPVDLSRNGSVGTLSNNGRCFLTAGAPGSASCAVTWTPVGSTPRTDVISATYNPNVATHAGSASSGAGNGSVTMTVPDTTPPSIACSAADGQWHAGNVSIGCTASDGGSGLASPADASFALSTTVPAGSETANAATGSRQVCDNAGNCTTATPVTGNKVDRKAPQVTLTRPANGATYGFLSTLLTPVTVSYSCADAGSGVASCAGTTANGSTLDTGLLALGPHTFTVTATDNAGNTTTTTTTYTVGLL